MAGSLIPELWPACWSMRMRAKAIFVKQPTVNLLEAPERQETLPSVDVPTGSGSYLRGWDIKPGRGLRSYRAEASIVIATPERW